MSRLRRALYGLVAAVAALLLVEGAARIVEAALPGIGGFDIRPGWQTVFFGRLFDWHEPDPRLLWRFKPNLDNPLVCTNSQHTIGREVGAKALATFRVLVVGDSSPVGLGLTSWRDTFPALLERHLQMVGGDSVPVEVVNAAVSGYSSEQVRRFLEGRAGEFQPDAIVVYCGSNDASLSGNKSDRELLDAQRLLFVRRNLKHLAMYRLLCAGLMCLRDDPDPAGENLKVRVSAERFRENLTAIANWCRDNRCRLVLCVPPVPLLWPAGLQFKVFQQVTDEQGELLLPDELRRYFNKRIRYCLDPDRFADLYGHGDSFTRAAYALGVLDSAEQTDAGLAVLLAAAEQSSNPVDWNNLGVALWNKGDFESAFERLERACSLAIFQTRSSSNPLDRSSVSPFLYNTGICCLSMEYDTAVLAVPRESQAYRWLDSSRNEDYLSLRIKTEYASVIKSFDKSPGVSVVDLAAVFAARDGERLFIDHCHPNRTGHRLIAKYLRLSLQDFVTGREQVR
jgi:lysophospholipase L1-like esterase